MGVSSPDIYLSTKVDPSGFVLLSIESTYVVGVLNPNTPFALVLYVPLAISSPS